eukprot:scaffold34682_cov79-Isochrysis_galbana.AAC.1
MQRAGSCGTIPVWGRRAGRYRWGGFPQRQDTGGEGPCRQIPAGGGEGAPVEVLGFLEDDHVALAFRNQLREIRISPLDDGAQKRLVGAGVPINGRA